MPYLIGVDEAGYGPNLGPLLIAATAWRVSSDAGELDLYRELNGAVHNGSANDKNDPRLVIADSKQVYKAGQGLDALERGVLASLANVRPTEHTDWANIWTILEPRHDDHRAAVPWPIDAIGPIPLATSIEEIQAAAKSLRQCCADAGVSLLRMRATAVYPGEFNERTNRLGTKGELLSRTTLQLVADLMSELIPVEPVLILCDRHGGRKAYGGLLQDIFSDHFVEVVRVTPKESRYRWGQPERRVEVRFCVGGESHLPVALASMTAKYLRELSMRAFNDFWRRQIPNLAPTAGYPVDAKRFKAEIAAVQRKLKIDDHVLWRAR